MVDIFISYAREDQEALRRLAAALEAQGWSVFWDRTIPAGETWRSYIGKALDDARCVVVAWSVASIESHWVQEEAEDARNKNILIPVLLAPIIPPIGFRSITAANLVGWDGDAEDELFIQFHADISRKLGDPPALIKEQERQHAEAERKAGELAVMLRLEAERKAVEFEERQHAEAERKAAELKEKQRAEAQRRARAQEAERRRETERPPERMGQQTVADANGEDRASPARELVTEELNPLRTKMAIALAIVISILAVVAWVKIPTAKYLLTVTTTPPDAVINIDNVGRYDPGMRLEAGTYKVRATLAGYQDVERTFEIAERDVALEITLPATYGLTVTTTPSNATINIENVGQYSPGVRLEAGTYRVRATLAGYQAVERTLEVSERDVVLNIALQPTLPLPELVQIPAGSFIMGREEDGSAERSVRTVHFDQPFYLGVTEVTFAQYDAFAAATGRRSPDNEGWGRGDRPVINVDSTDARDYAQWLSEVTGNSCRLPSEAEWEYAARAGTETRYGLPAPTGGDNLSGYANCYDCGRSEHVREELKEQIGKRTLPSGSFPANAWGLHDMHGNVSEWMADCWHASYEGAPVDGSAWLEESGKRCGRHVLRGGSWFNDRGYLQSAYRIRFNPDERLNFIGFRVLCSSPILNADH